MKKKCCALLVCAFVVLPLFRLSAQIYEIDCLVKDYAEAYDELNTDDYMKKNDVGYKDKSVRIPNGTEVTLKQVIKNKAYNLPNHLRYNAEIGYDGKTMYVFAWNLKFSDKNPEGTADPLKEYDMSPNPITFTGEDPETGGEYKHNYNMLDVRSAEGRMLLSRAYLIAVLVLLLSAAVLQFIASRIVKQGFTYLTAVFAVFALAAAILMEAYYLIRLGPLSIWFCDVQYFTIGQAVRNSIPFIFTIFLQVFSIILFRNNLSVFMERKLTLKPSVILFFFSLIAIFFALLRIPSEALGISEETLNTPGQYAAAVQKMFLFIAVALPVPAMLFYGIKHKFMGLFAGIFLTFYWLGTITAIGLLAYAVIRIFIAIMCQVIMYIAAFIYASRFGGFVQIGSFWIGPDGSTYREKPAEVKAEEARRAALEKRAQKNLKN